MKKVFDQTVRDLKREVNKKVLKIPGIEQKILDATSNEPWGPHGSVLADIAQATRNYHEYQIIMTVIWKRINDTRKNWRHVYKGLSVLEYLVAHGSERVIDEIREHAYQISTLSDFQYTDSSGRDQGSNVRRKSQNLVALVNDKERIQEVRQKAHVNRDKSNDTYSTGGMHQPSPYSGRGGYGDLYDDEHYDGRYGNRDDQNGRDRESRDVDRYTRGGDLNNRGGDRYSRDTDEHCDRDGSRDDEHKGSRGNDHHFGSRSRSTDGEEDHSSNGDHRHSSRDGHGRTDKPLHGKRQLECKYSDKSLGAPPSYEEATGEHHNYVQDERDGGSVQSPLPKAPSPALPQVSSLESVNHGQTLPEPDAALSQTDKQIDSFDEFDPRGSVAATAPAGTGPEVDIFGLSAVDPITSSALMPVIADATSEPDILNNLDLGTNLGTLSSAANVFNQIVDDPFGDSPFKAIPQDDNSFVQQQNLPPVTYFQPQTGSMSDPEAPQPVAQMMQSIASFDFGDSFHATTPNVMINQVSTRTSETLPPELATPPDTVPPGTIGPHSDAVAPGSIVLHPHAVAPGSLLPHMETTITASSHVFQPGTSATAELNHTNILSQPAPSASQEYVAIYLPHSGLSASTHPQVSPYSLPQWGSATLPPVSQSFPSHHLSQPGQSAPIAAQIDTPNPLSELGISISPQDVPSSVLSQPGLSAPLASQAVPSTILSQPGLSAFASSQVTPPAPTGPPTKSTQREDRFETKSTVWADTLSRGLVNLNISGPKINPLAEIGIDFESINRKEKRKEKEKTSAAPVSTVTMGKAMGTGSGIGRAGASALAPSSNPMMGSGKGMGMSMGNGGVSMGMGNGGMSMGIGNGGMNMGMGMGVGYGGGMSQPMGMGMGMGTNMGMGVNLGMGQAAPIQPPAGIGLPAGPATPAFGYNTMMGMGGPGGYGSQQQYGGYR